MSFNTRIKALRGNLTMQEFGEKINTKVPTISAWENSGTLPSIQKLIQLSKDLNVSTDYLLDLSDDDSYVVSETSFKSIPYSKILESNEDLDDNPTAIIQYKNEHKPFKKASYTIDEYGEISKRSLGIPEMPVIMSLSLGINPINSKTTPKFDPNDLLNLKKNTVEYTTKPLNTLIFAQARSGLQLEYLIPTLNLISHSKDKKNIINNSNHLKQDLLPNLKNLGYTQLQFSKQQDGLNKSDKFNILENLKSIQNFGQLLKIINDLIDSNSTYLQNLTVKNRTKEYFALYICDYFSENIDKPVSFNGFATYLKEILKLESNQKDLFLINLQQFIQELANDPYVEYMDSDHTNYLQNVKPLFVNAPINYDTPELDISLTINNIFKYYFLTENKPTQWITSVQFLDLDPTYISIGLGVSQSMTIISDVSDILTNATNHIDLILGNCDLIINYAPENPIISKFISQKTKVSPTITKYSLFNNETYDIIIDQSNKIYYDDPTDNENDELQSSKTKQILLSLTDEQTEMLSDLLKQLTS